MYSRYPDRPERPLHIPDHYSGCAFRQDSDTPPISVPFSEPPCPTPEPEPAPPPHHAPPANRMRELFGGTLPSLPGGLDGDELLLIGLILLLARSGDGSDVLPWLALLLFCK